MTNYARGAKRERDFADRLEADGWVVARTAGSHGVMDLVACKAGMVPRFVQVKSDRRGPYANFGPKARRELWTAAEQAGAVPVLIHWPPDRQGPRWYFADAWPSH